MTKIERFTVEEQQLIALFGHKDNRLALMRVITKADNLDEETKKVAKSVLDRLAGMTDEEYNDTSFEQAL